MTQTICKWVEIDNISQIKSPLFWPWSVNYKCKGFGYFFDKATGYGYMGTNSHAKDLWSYWRNAVLSWFGLCIEWRCDGTGKSRIRKQ